MIRTLLVLCCISFLGYVKGQSAEHRYWVFLTDKSANEYMLSAPESFLSAASLERRERLRRSADMSDLPVCEVYIQQLRDAGATIHVASKWLNAVSVTATEAQLSQISMLDCVSGIQPVVRYRILNEQLSPINEQTFYKQAAPADITAALGYAAAQIEQINLDTLLEIGLSGDSMVIAVLDAGFFGVDTASLFQSFWDKEQILGYYNFPGNDDQVFNIWSGYHGSWVMSVIAGDIDSVYSGSAPDADLYLYRTEIAETEYVVEEDHWLAAAERADSVGADIINSSLGYTEFDDPAENHTWADLDGNTTVVTVAADMAAEKGILVCNSAGNLGASAWHYISMPADGDSVFTIGGVSIDSNHAGFSGFGPTADGRLKPNVVALAAGSAVLSPDGYVAYLSGTSFSSPLIAGACATLWQAFPEATNMDIMRAVEMSAHLYATPNDSMGYGIPNFGKAYALLDSLFPDVPVDTTGDTTVIDTTGEDTTITSTILDLVPYMDGGIFTVQLQSSANLDALFSVYNMQGALMHQDTYTLTAGQPLVTSWDASVWSQGVYVCVLRSGPFKQSVQVFVQ